MNWYRLNISQVYELLGAMEGGLSSAAAEKKLLETGSNELQEAKRKTISSILLSQFRDIMILILLVAAVISGIIGEITDTIVILIIVLLNAILGFFQEYRAENAVRALKQFPLGRVKVFRDGAITWLPAPRLVPGDIILLEAGDAVPADIRITESVNLRIEESALTGESLAADKIADTLQGKDLPVNDQRNMAFKGTFVSFGRARGIVVATGMQTEIGNIARMLGEEEAPSPLQVRISSFAKKLSAVVLLLCMIFFVAGWLRGEEFMKMLLSSISLAVAAIPEALPAAITISLALAARRMIRFNSLIRKLSAVETLGSVTCICTDKTGTLTKNKMYVESVFVNRAWHGRNALPAIKHQEELILLLHACVMNNDAVVDGNKNIKGESTETALMEFAIEQGIHPGAWPRLAEIVFDSNRKLMTTFHRHHDKIISFTKGAPDILLDRCANIDIEEFHRIVDEMAENGHRVLGFACRYWDSLPKKTDMKIHEYDLQFLGLVAITDPPRQEVKEAIAECKKAGIMPVMITGDHPLTARAIAQRIGILYRKNDETITGQQLAALDPKSFADRAEKIKVYARVSPEQKLQIIKMLQQKGHYVAMTGDGVNDAPSLKRANIGIAMGIAGTDISREAAHMVLLDDNFSTIVTAIREGRRIYDNLLKLIKYLVTTNSGELWTLLLGPLVGLPIALLPIHILWINLVSDGLPAISLSFEKAEQDIMSRPPRSPQEGIFAGNRGWDMLWVGLLMAGIALAMQSWAIKNGWHWQTIVFNIICLSQMGHALAIRSEKQSLFTIGLFSNKLMLGSVMAVLLLQFAITYIPLLQQIFHTEALSLTEFIITGVVSSLVFLAVEIEKRFKKKLG